MNTGDRLQNRFNQLRELMEAIPGKENNEVDGIAWNHFATSTRNLILEVFGLHSKPVSASCDLPSRACSRSMNMLWRRRMPDSRLSWSLSF